MKFIALAVVVALAVGQGLMVSAQSKPKILTIHNNKFMLDGKPLQIISGSIHYFRIHPSHWRDRLLRVQAMGLNAITVYVPWNVHEPNVGRFVWTGFADVQAFLSIAHELGLYVLLRPGPYICAEWDFGGLPWWLASPKVIGNGVMELRNNDAAFMLLVKSFWSKLFSHLYSFMSSQGGPIIMVQVENEYGFCGLNPEYLEDLLTIARKSLPEKTMFFTVDPPNVLKNGTLPGPDVLSTVDFGPGWCDIDKHFAAQSEYNPRHRSPPMCTEFYTGWLTHWGESMANTSTPQLIDCADRLLNYAGKSASVSFYMVAGGSNFGFRAGGNVDGDRFAAHITSYDYDGPISESGDYGQPGIGGGNKYDELRRVIHKATGAKPPAKPPRPPVRGWGPVRFERRDSLLDVLEVLGPGKGIYDEFPKFMEYYDQQGGLILYRTHVDREDLVRSLAAGGQQSAGLTVLQLGSSPHDLATVLVNGKRQGTLKRGESTVLTIALPDLIEPRVLEDGSVEPPPGGISPGQIRLDIIVEALGRSNGLCGASGFDTKGLQNETVMLDNLVLKHWAVYPLPMEAPSAALERNDRAILETRRLDESAQRRLRRHARQPQPQLLIADSEVQAELRRYSEQRSIQEGANHLRALEEGPAIFRGVLEVNATRTLSGLLPDTYLDMSAWGRGVVFVNDFNLGWYWSSEGPQMTLYVPGPVLREGSNSILVLETESPPPTLFDAKLVSVRRPNFAGPHPALKARDPRPLLAPWSRFFHTNRH
ncbi:glycosyl hydrolase [Helicosporidium sp. ATCC 50920]|nr:glycosyl hydrolase [Helicosporidium sp. ATCC 50920]|eukprot:KDD75891.1 glycosyl hydrolase [Helicosporidium sp. ATCC 50920]